MKIRNREDQETLELTGPETTTTAPASAEAREVFARHLVAAQGRVVSSGESERILGHPDVQAAFEASLTALNDWQQSL